MDLRPLQAIQTQSKRAFCCLRKLHLTIPEVNPKKGPPENALCEKRLFKILVAGRLEHDHFISFLLIHVIWGRADVEICLRMCTQPR